MLFALFPSEIGLILKLALDWGQAVSILVRNLFIFSEGKVLILLTSSFDSSENGLLSCGKLLEMLVRQDEMSQSLQSDGLSSLIVDQMRPPVLVLITKFGHVSVPDGFLGANIQFQLGILLTCEFEGICKLWLFFC